ncbi:type IV secretion system protein [Escherichia coli]|uniref:type IV secretion system protein n=1 Tax=Escherichia coli TaxID=562 RepID=UPI002358C757|nr:type IV secretion system protein [Escherichia coli]MDC9067864.1 type IV secretion system protein [Escherichia coli]
MTNTNCSTTARRTPARRTGIAANRCSSIRRCPSRTLLTSGKISDTLSDISNLASRIENAKDSKESQDLANVVSARSIS